jgi:hypothetical protein
MMIATAAAQASSAHVVGAVSSTSSRHTSRGNHKLSSACLSPSVLSCHQPHHHPQRSSSLASGVGRRRRPLHGASSSISTTRLQGLFGGRGDKSGGDANGAAGSSPNNINQKLETFPKDYAQLVTQAQRALQAALDNGVDLMEIQFPPGGLDSVPGDVEGNTENNLTVQYLRGICSQFERNKTAKTTRVFFPDPIEQSLALTGAAPSPDGVRPPENSQTIAMFADFPGRTDYLEAPDFLSVSGLDKLLNKRVTLEKRVKASDTAGLYKFTLSLESAWFQPSKP